MVSPLASLKRGVLRPRDAEEIYVQPYAEFHRWEKEGVLLKVAHGYYALIPEASRGGHWRPSIEALALGIGQADYGRNDVALMHLSAARIHASIPRAIAVAVLAVPKQRPTLETIFGRIYFVKRKVGGLKRIRTETELGAGWVTSMEQTLLDIAKRPNLVDGMENVADEAVMSLNQRVDLKKTREIAEVQRMTSVFNRIENWNTNA